MTSVDVVVRLIDEAFDRKSWHGTNLRGSIRGLSIEDAAWRPAARRHNVWELIVHAAYWKYTVWRRLTGQKRSSFPIKGSNWFRRECGANSTSDWRADVRLLGDMHRQLRAVVAELQPADLERRAPGAKVTIGWLVTGIAAHDLYHAGQVQLIKRLHR